MDSESQDKIDSSRCKIDRVATKYDLDDLDRMVRHRRRKNGASLRDLERLINTQILDAALAETDVDILGDAASVYEVLTGSDVDTRRLVNVQDQMEKHGIDLEELESDFISYQTVRTHLNDCLGVDTSRQGVESIEEGYEIIRGDRQRHQEVVSRTIARFSRLNLVQIENPTVTVSTTIECESCKRTYRILEFLEQGRCECGGRFE